MPSIFSKPLSFVSSLTLLGSLAFSLDVKAETLTGGVEHVARLSPLSPQFRLGTTITNIDMPVSSDSWFKVPNWLAGQWKVDTERTTLVQEFDRAGRVARSISPNTTFKAKTTFTYGQQEDSTGGIWHYVGIPYSSSTELAEGTELHQVTEKRLAAASPERAAIVSRVTVLKLNRNKQIMESYQQESITSYSPVSSDRLELRASTKVFDVQGQPMRLVENEGLVRRSAPFHSQDNQDGKDLRLLFEMFLTQHVPGVVPARAGSSR